MEDFEAEGWYDEDCDPQDHGPRAVRTFDRMSEEFPLNRVPDVLRRPVRRSQLREWMDTGVNGRRLKAELRGRCYFVRRADLFAFIRGAYGDL